MLAIVDLAAFRQLAFLLAVGVLIDSFFVRSLFVPALVALFGRTHVEAGGERSGPDSQEDRVEPVEAEMTMRRPAALSEPPRSRGSACSSRHLMTAPSTVPMFHAAASEHFEAAHQDPDHDQHESEEQAAAKRATTPTTIRMMPTTQTMGDGSPVEDGGQQ